MTSSPLVITTAVASRSSIKIKSAFTAFASVIAARSPWSPSDEPLVEPRFGELLAHGPGN